MANGDAAAAAGMDVVPGTADRRQGYDEINKTRDYLANHTKNGGHAWGKISDKPSVFPTNTSQISDRDQKLILNQTSGSNRIGLRWDTGRLRARVDNSEVGTLAYLSDIPSVPAPSETARYASGPTGDAYGRTVAGGNFAVWMDSSYQFGRNVSSRRYKEDIAEHHVDAAAVLALQPVTYRRTADQTGTYEYGLIAEDVHEALPEIVTHFDGQVDGVRYDLLAVALLDVARAQQTQIDALTTRLDALEAPPTPEA